MKKIISNPFYQGVFAIIVFGVSLYFSLRKDKGQFPLYSVEPSRIIAITPSNKLKILWDKDTLDNVKIARIVLWNGGDDYIDKANLSNTYPLVIKANSKCKILEVKTVQSSRQSLIISSVIDGASNSIVLSMQGDDAIDPKDGIVYQILFSSNDKIDWTVDGRVKNVPNGFKRIEWKDATDKRILYGVQELFLPVYISLIGLLLGVLIIVSFIKNRDRVKKTGLLVAASLLVMGIASGYNSYEIAKKMHDKEVVPSWVKV